MRRTLIPALALVALWLTVREAFQRDAHGEIPVAFVQEVPEEVRAWRVTCVPYPMDPAIAGDNSPTIPALSLGPVLPGRYFRDFGVLASLGPPRHTAGGSTWGYYAIGTSFTLAQDRERIESVTLGNLYANSADDPIVKACRFEFTEGIRFGMSRAEVQEHLESAYRMQRAWLTEKFPHFQIPEEIAHPVWAVFHMRAGGATIFNGALMLHFMHDQLIAVDLR